MRAVLSESGHLLAGWMAKCSKLHGRTGLLLTWGTPSGLKDKPHRQQQLRIRHWPRGPYSQRPQSRERDPEELEALDCQRRGEDGQRHGSGRASWGLVSQ